jgi:adenylate kinase family enzyme
MSSAACTNKGFILDGYPRNINDAKHIFLNKIENYQPPVHNDGAESQSVQESLFPGYELNKDIIP